MTPARTTPVRHHWIGPWLLVGAGLHTAFAVLAYGPVLRQLAGLGWVNSVGQDPLRAAVAWFLLFGAPLALLGLTVTPLQRQGQAVVLRRLGAGLLALAALGLSLMPVSGFWLVLPAALALLRSR